MHISSCEYCGKEKEYKYKSQIKRFCSHACARKAVPKTPGEKVTLRCEHCGKEFEVLKSAKKSREKNGGYKVKYCSQECDWASKIKSVEVNCLNCNKTFSTTRNKFCSQKCVFEYRKKYGFVCSRKNSSFKRNGYWYENGYKILYTEDGKGIKEHIKVMEEHIGRKLLPNEVVHHINEIKDDNRLENLMLMTRSEHSRYHRLKELAEGKRLFK